MTRTTSDKTKTAPAAAQSCSQPTPVIVKVDDIYEACAHMVVLGARIIREPGPATFDLDATGDFDVIAMIEDVDGNRIKLVERIKRPHRAGIFL